jgi:hypothetical protein
MPVQVIVATVAASIVSGEIHSRYYNQASPPGSRHTGSVVVLMRVTIVGLVNTRWLQSRGSVLKFDDGREHIAKWTQLFDGDASIGQEEFNARLSTLAFEMPAGPSETLNVIQAIPSQVTRCQIPHQCIPLSSRIGSCG